MLNNQSCISLRRFFLLRDAIEILIRVLEHRNYFSNNSGYIMPSLKLVYSQGSDMSHRPLVFLTLKKFYHACTCRNLHFKYICFCLTLTATEQALDSYMGHPSLLRRMDDPCTYESSVCGSLLWNGTSVFWSHPFTFFTQNLEVVKSLPAFLITEVYHILVSTPPPPHSPTRVVHSYWMI